MKSIYFKYNEMSQTFFKETFIRGNKTKVPTHSLITTHLLLCQFRLIPTITNTILSLKVWVMSVKI